MFPSARVVQQAVDLFICLTQLGILSVWVLFTATSLHQLHGQFSITNYILILFLPVILLAFIRYTMRETSVLIVVAYCALICFCVSSCIVNVNIAGTSDYWLQSPPWPP